MLHSSNSAFDEAVSKGKPYLKAYLESMGVSLHGNRFRCINPEHEDHDPSCYVNPKENYERFKCFGCGVGGDIYTAAHLLEDKPIRGPGFIQDNLEYILNKFSIPHDKIELSDEQLERYRYHKVYSEASRLLTEEDSDGRLVYTSLDYASSRGWSRDTCLDLGIAEVIDYKGFMKSLSLSTGYDRDTLLSMGITPNLFGKEKLTFSVRDKNGNCVAFVVRNINWKKGSRNPKYDSTSGVRNPFFRKGMMLYGLDIAKAYTGLRLDIFEGHGSFVTAYQAGMRNCVALGGSILSTEQVELLYSLGFRHINLALDRDGTGEQRMEEYIEKFSGYKDLKVTIIFLPLDKEEIERGDNDPDYFIRTRGLEEYKAIPPVTAFDHMINKNLPKAEDKLEFAKEMCRLIINEPNMIERGRMIKCLSQKTGIDSEDIKLEIERLESISVSHVKEDIVRNIRAARDSDSLVEALDTSIVRVRDMTVSRKDRYIMSVEESVEAWRNIFLSADCRKVGIHGWTTGFKRLDFMLDGIAKPENGGVLYGIAGAPQHAKSATAMNIAYRVSTLNNDATVLYWAIDDNRVSIAYRLLSLASGIGIRKVRRLVDITDREALEIKEAEDKLIELCAEGRLIFKDDSFGRSKSRAERWIKEMQDKFGRPVLFIVDSLHNVYGEGEIRKKIVDTSMWLKSMCAMQNISVIATIELIKNRGLEKPNLQMISESGKIEFDFDAIAIVYNELQARYGNLEETYALWDHNGIMKPILEVDIQKNKSAAGDKGQIFYKFDPDTTSLGEEFDSLKKCVSEKGTEIDLGIDNTISGFE